MTRLLRGTSGNDIIDAGGFDRVVFSDIGFGRDTVTGGANSDIFHMRVDKNVDHVDGGAGRDLIDYAASDVQLNIDLSTGIVLGNFGSSAARNWMAVTDVRNVEDVIGSRFDDTIVGSDAANVLSGGEGNDVIHAGDGDDILIGGTGGNILDGGKGIDTVDYSASDYSVLADLAGGTGIDWDPQPGGWPLVHTQDIYTSIENLTGSMHDDRLTGNAGANVIDGGAGNDIIRGGGGNDTLRGGAGDDQVTGGDGNDQIFGGAGNDVLRGGLGINHYDGGDGVDTVDYSGGNSVWVGLGSDWGHRGEIRAAPGVILGSDTYTSIENIQGSNYADGIFGDEGANVINGNGGNDHLFGEGGDDTINGGDGDDVIRGDAGGDHLDGGSGNNWLMYTWSDAGVTVNLATSTANGGHATGDVISNFQNIMGSTHDDVLIGSNDDNILIGWDGNDRLTGGGGHDTFAFLGAVKGHEVITDFHIGEDRLAFLQGNPMQGMHLSQQGADTVITFDNGPGAIILQHVNTSDFVQHLSAEIEYPQIYEALL